MMDAPHTMEIEAVPQLTTDERQLLQDLVASPGWRVLTEKVWRWKAHNLLRTLTTQKEDLRWYQGHYAGLMEAKTLAGAFARFQPDYIPTSTVTDADLRAKARKF